jgi:site-specific DNA-methyltransferase (adenine-specific)
MLRKNMVYHGGCLELMKYIDDKSIDMILCDLPYGTTACKWDVIIPFESLWEQYKRIIKDNGAIVLTGSQPFTSLLISSNSAMFKYELIWDKNKGCQPALANIKPMQSHENILVFGKGRTIYNPQMEVGEPYKRINKGYNQNNHNIGLKPTIQNNEGTRYPKSILKFSRDFSAQNRLHPTQKPVALFEYLIKTYTNEEDLVLDNCAGSGTTGISCINTNRNYICMEKEEKYFNIINDRINQLKETMNAD